MYKISREDNPSPEDILTLHNGIMQFNKTVFAGSKARQMSIFIRDEKNQVMGGIIFFMDGRSIYLESLWINDDLRKQKFGSKLLQMAEEEGIKEGCTFSTLDTFSFQAEEFYLKNGYKRVCEVKDHMLGYARISFRKEF